MQDADETHAQWSSKAALFPTQIECPKGSVGVAEILAFIGRFAAFDS